jgi:2-oxoglutarate ferredoxin oxidoreductase subunit beta
VSDTIIDSSQPPTVPARKVEVLKPSLLLTQEHQMCPGCGEPLAVRQFLETIEDLGVAHRAIAVAGIGCYTAFSGTIDVDLVQALHGRAPSVATGVKRMLPDALVFTLQGDGDMVNEGLQEVLHTAARGEKVRDERDRPAHEELDRRPRRRLPRLPDPDR